MSRLPMKLQILQSRGAQIQKHRQHRLQDSRKPMQRLQHHRSIMIRLRSLSRENSLWQKKAC